MCQIIDEKWRRRVDKIHQEFRRTRCPDGKPFPPFRVFQAGLLNDLSAGDSNSLCILDLIELRVPLLISHEENSALSPDTPEKGLPSGHLSGMGPMSHALREGARLRSGALRCVLVPLLQETGIPDDTQENDHE